MKRIFLVPKATTDAQFSIEAGKADGERHFDHHGVHADEPCPTIDDRIPSVGSDAEIEITHMDADTLIGLMRLCGMCTPDELDLALIAHWDTHGTKGARRTRMDYLYFIGVNTMAAELKFPTAKDGERIDVTDIVSRLLINSSVETMAEYGRRSQNTNERAFKNNLMHSTEDPKIGLWVINGSELVGGGRAYEDGFEVVIVYSRRSQDVNIFCDPDSKLDIFNLPGEVEVADNLPPNYQKTIGGIRFCGRPDACGSPRGEQIAEDGLEQFFTSLTDPIVTVATV